MTPPRKGNVVRVPQLDEQSDRTDPEITMTEPAVGKVPALINDGPTGRMTIPIKTMPNLGPIETFMNDPAVSEIMVNDLRNVMLEKEGKISFSGFRYQTAEDLQQLIRNLLEFSGQSSDSPYMDMMLPDGSRVNIVLPPLTVTGPCVTIRKFPAKQFMIEDLMAKEMLDQRIAYFLNLCVIGKMNILVSGGTGSGKTTLLNVLCSFIPKGERIVTIEDTPELSIRHANSVRMQTQPVIGSKPGVTARELVANSLRMRPDRIIVGECRRGEALDMLQAMNTGHTGSMTTIHANAPRDALSRVETLCMMGGVELPLLAIRKQVCSAIDLIVHIQRFRNGKRRITSVTEVTGMEADTYTLQDIFYFEPDMKDPAKAEGGAYKCTGFVPSFLDRLREQGLDFPQNYFG